MHWKKGTKGTLQLVLNHICITIKQCSVNKRRLVVHIDFPRYSKYFREVASIEQIKEWAEDWIWEVLDSAMVMFEEDDDT